MLYEISMLEQKTQPVFHEEVVVDSTFNVHIFNSSTVTYIGN